MPFWWIERRPRPEPSKKLDVGDRVVFSEHLSEKERGLAEKLAQELGSEPYIIVPPEPISSELAEDLDHVYVKSPTRREYVPRVLLARESRSG